MEKRREPRFISHIPLRYRDLRNTNRTQTGSLTRDISESGLRFIIHCFMPLATRLVVSLSIPQSSKPVKLITKIAWLKRLGDTNHYEAGAQLLGIEEDGRDIVLGHLNRLAISNN